MNEKNEDVLVVSRKHLPVKWCQPQVGLPAFKTMIRTLNNLPFSFIPRNLAEEEPAFKQLIPYVIVEWNGQIALYQRAGSEKRLAGLWSIGVGGHVNTSDCIGSRNFIAILMAGAQRELYEEFNIRQHHHPGFRFLGIVNEELTDVGKVHLGLVLVCSLKVEALPGDELKNMKWVWPDEVAHFETELWSNMAYQLYNEQVMDRKRMSASFTSLE